MKIYNLHIDFAPSWDTYHQVSAILNVVPAPFQPSKFDTANEPADWHYQLHEQENDPPIDFINELLDILEPNFGRLQALGIEKSNILFSLVYEYQHQCALEFHPQEMERLGRSGIALNIDCFDALRNAP